MARAVPCWTARISTHAPLAGRDCNSSRSCLTSSISTHAPLAGRDDFPTMVSQSKFAFQPTRPLRGATFMARSIFSVLQNFNPRAPCGARLRPQIAFLIHVTISTHAPLAGRDHAEHNGAEDHKNFNPRAPCGARLLPPLSLPRILLFQPTRPLRGATFDGRVVSCVPEFQPTRPLRGATAVALLKYVSPEFQPTRPLRGATEHDVLPLHHPAISTHAPLAGRDSKRVQITMHIFAITDKFQMLLHRMPPVRAFCSFLMQENHADFGCEPPK